jgi:hypothetical protein
MLGLIALLTLGAIAASRDSKNKALNAIARIDSMEEKYEKYVEKNIHSHVLEKNNLQVDPNLLALDTLKFILPDLNGLISLINTTTHTTVEINHTAQYFPNLVSLTENYFRQSQKSKIKKLSPEEEENFRKTALNAIQADVQRRLLDLKIGDL